MCRVGQIIMSECDKAILNNEDRAVSFYYNGVKVTINIENVKEGA